MTDLDADRFTLRQAEQAREDYAADGGTRLS
jgi:hypothetical protein